MWKKIETLRLGLDLGPPPSFVPLNLYGDGRAEELIGEAIAGRRDETFLVSKVYPHNASRRGTVSRMRPKPPTPWNRPD